MLAREWPNPAIFQFVLHPTNAYDGALCVVFSKCLMGSVELNVGRFLNSPWKLHQKSFLSISSLSFCLLITEVTYNKISKYLIFPLVWFRIKLEFNVNACLECSLRAPMEQLEGVRVDCPVSASVKWNFHFSVLGKKLVFFVWGFVPFTQRDWHPLK